MAAAKSSFHAPLLLLAVSLGLLSSPGAADEFLLSGQTLNPGQSLTNCGITLSMQTDCNVVLYENGAALWSTGTSNRGSNCRLSMQKDGNLVLYDGSGNALWSSGTSREEGNYVLVLQRDRNVVIYGGSIWATGTSRNTVTGKPDAKPAAGAVVVVNGAASAEVEPGLGRSKIHMVTNKA